MASWSRSTRARICQETVLQPIFMVYNRDTTQDSFGSQAFYSMHRRWEGLGTRLICRLESKVHIFHLCPWVFYLLGGTPLHPAWRMRPPLLQCHLSLQQHVPSTWDMKVSGILGRVGVCAAHSATRQTNTASFSIVQLVGRENVGIALRQRQGEWEDLGSSSTLYMIATCTKNHASVTRIAGDVWAFCAQQWYS